jgi:hypothetical protein
MYRDTFSSCRTFSQNTDAAVHAETLAQTERSMRLDPKSRSYASGAGRETQGHVDLISNEFHE